MNKYFIDVIKNHYIDFAGRATRTQFWMFFVFYIIILVTLVCVIPIISALIPALLLPYLAITLRRFRDAGVSPVWFVTLKGLQCVGIIFLCLPVMFVFLTIITLGGFDPQEATFDNLFKIGGLLFCLSAVVELIICALPSKKVLPSEQVLSNEQALPSEQQNEQIK